MSPMRMPDRLSRYLRTGSTRPIQPRHGKMVGSLMPYRLRNLSGTKPAAGLRRFAQPRHGSLQDIHEKVVGVDMSSELPEQEMIFKHLRKDASVLEFGGNIGRASILISKLLANPHNHVVLESDPDIARTLNENKVQNNCGFHVVNAALSRKPLIQNEWNTKTIDSASAQPPAGWKHVPTITYQELIRRHPIQFDTIVADCEGCMHEILRAYPQVLEKAHTIIIENDAQFISNEMNDGIRRTLWRKGFTSVECRAHDSMPCFYEVWKR